MATGGIIPFAAKRRLESRRMLSRRMALFIARIVLLLITGIAMTSCAPLATTSNVDLVRAQVEAAERGFAKSMAERNLADFADRVSEEAVFFTGPTPLRGKGAVVAWWSRYFTDAAAPFSWEPDQVEPLSSGTLALSSGPVRNQEGKVIARFNSIWRLEAPGVWRVVFDKGSPAAGALP